MHDQLVIIGASGHGKVIADIALCIDKYKEIVFLDDDETLHEAMGLPIVGKVCDSNRFLDRAEFYVAIGNANTRKIIQTDLAEKNAGIATLIHPGAIIGRNVTIGKGTAIMAGVVINVDTAIGEGCIINTCASIDHDCRIGDFAHISVGSHLAGNVVIGDKVWIGIGAAVVNNMTVCDDCTIGAGAVVNRNIVETGTYVGVPIRKLNTEGIKKQVFGRSEGGVSE